MQPRKENTPVTLLPWPEIGLLVLFVALRIHNLTLLPVFVDEVYYITWARLLLLGDFSGFATSTFHAKPLMPWLLAILGPLANGLWLSRITIILLSTLGLATLIALGRFLLGRKTSLIAGIIYSVLPFSFFFERLAMSDPPAASLGLISSWLVIISLLSRRRRYATLAGIVLALAIFVRLSMLIYVLIPVIAWLLLVSRKRETLPILIWIYMTTLALILTPAIGLSRFTDFGLSFMHSYNYTSFDLATLPGRSWKNALDCVGWMGIWVGWPVLVGGIIGMGRALLKWRRGAVFLTILTCLPIFGLWVAGYTLFPRFYLPSVGVFVLLGVWGGRELMEWFPKMRKVSYSLGALFLTVALIPMVIFIAVAYVYPPALSITDQEHTEYILNRYSGYAPREAASWLKNYAEKTTGITILCPQLLDCNALEIYLYGTPGIRFVSIDTLTPEWLEEQINAGYIVLFPRESVSPSESYISLEAYTTEPIATFSRPLGGEPLTFFQVK